MQHFSFFNIVYHGLIRAGTALSKSFLYILLNSNIDCSVSLVWTVLISYAVSFQNSLGELLRREINHVEIKYLGIFYGS